MFIEFKKSIRPTDEFKSIKGIEGLKRANRQKNSRKGLTH